MPTKRLLESDSIEQVNGPEGVEVIEGVGVIDGVIVSVGVGGVPVGVWVGIGVLVFVVVLLGVGECSGWKSPPKYTLMYLSCESVSV